MQLDKKDSRILAALDFNARISLGQLAKEVGLSKQSTEYRLKRLEKSVITGYYPVIDVWKLGYTYCRYAITLNETSDATIDKLNTYLSKKDQVCWVFRVHGSIDIFFAMWAKTLTEFRHLIDDINDKFGNLIKGTAESIATDVIHYKQRYIMGQKDPQEIHLAETDTSLLIDDLDKQILNELSKNARKSFVEIAQQVGVSAKVVAYRVKRMEKTKLILCYRPGVNYDLLGFTYYKVFLNYRKKSPELIMKLREYIKSSPLSLYIVEGIGLHGDIDFEIMVKDNNQLFDFMDSIRNKFDGIEDYSTIVFKEQKKLRYLPY